MTRPEGRSGSVRLSSGRLVALPLRCRCSLAGIVVTADKRRLSRTLPTGLSPVPLGRSTAAVVLLGLDYHAVGDVDPYDEFGVVVPVLHRRAGLPAGVGGWVDALPVTSEASRRLGREVWGYPKTVRPVSVDVSGTTASVRVGGQGTPPDVALEVAVEGGEWAVDALRERAGRLFSTLGLRSYTELDGRLVRTRVTVSAGDLAVGVGEGASTSLSLGTGPLADGVRALGPTGRVVSRFLAHDVVATLDPPEAVD